MGACATAKEHSLDVLNPRFDVANTIPATAGDGDQENRECHTPQIHPQHTCAGMIPRHAKKKNETAEKVTRLGGYLAFRCPLLRFHLAGST